MARLCLLFLLLLPLAAKDLPNIVIIYADDLGYGDVQCYNPERGKIPTPHIDKLASEGMRFTDGHSSSGVCSPSRYTLLTGRYHWRSRLQSGIVGLWGPPLITPERMTIGSLAQQHGYRTACVGKWHLGWNWPIPADNKKLFSSGGYNGNKDIIATDEHRAAWREVFSQAIPGGPNAVGFDQYFGTDVPNWPPYCFIRDDRTLGIPSTFLPANLFENHQASQQGPALEAWALERILPRLGVEASAFIAESAGKDTPFLLYMPLTAPHTPLSVNEEWKGKSGLGLYADLVMETDAVIGQVLQAIDKADITDRTLVLLTSDNGCAHYVGIPEVEKKGHFPSGPLRGYKGDVWEGGHRVPYIVRWPGEVKAGSRCDQLVHQADLLATLAEIMGTQLPANAGEDSFSLMPLLKGGDQPIRPHSVSCSVRGTPSLRHGDWKYIAGTGSGNMAKEKLHDPKRPKQAELYNLSEDLAEQNNLAAAMPDRLAQMQDLLEKLITDGRSTPGPRQANDVEVRRHKPARP